MTASPIAWSASLPHGQRQWVEIGMVLSTDPELILLDEPAAGMTHEEVHKPPNSSAKSTAPTP